MGHVPFHTKQNSSETYKIVQKCKSRQTFVSFPNTFPPPPVPLKQNQHEMVLFQMLPAHSAVPLVAALLVVTRLAVASYPQYSKSRYSRSMAWAPLPLSYYYPPRSTRPIYYPDSDYYYPQEPPSYYPVYQSVMPNYYLDQQRPYYYGYDDVSTLMNYTHL